MDLLLVEAHGPLARHLGSGLEEEGFAVHFLKDPDKAQDLLRSRKMAVVILDIALDRGQTVLQNWRRAGIVEPVLVLSAPGSPLEKVNELGLGPGAFLAKPFGFDDLLDRLAVLTNHNSSLARKESTDEPGRL
jgi:DNA-binding response OmpR family regulator